MILCILQRVGQEIKAFSPELEQNKLIVTDVRSS